MLFACLLSRPQRRIYVTTCLVTTSLWQDFFLIGSCVCTLALLALGFLHPLLYSFSQACLCMRCPIVQMCCFSKAHLSMICTYCASPTEILANGNLTGHSSSVSLKDFFQEENHYHILPLSFHLVPIIFWGTVSVLSSYSIRVSLDVPIAWYLLWMTPSP